MAADAAALTSPIGDEAAAVLAQPSPLASFWAAFRENRGALFGLVVFAVIVLLALTAECRRAPFADRAVPRRGAGAAGLGGRRLVALRRSEPTATVTTCCRA